MSEDTPTINPDEAGCRLYLIDPPRLEPAGLAPTLEAALSGGGGAAFLLRSGDQATASAAALREVCRAHEVAFLVEDDLELALEVGADGVHLRAADRVAEARERLGRERILGVSCGVSRHRAMVAGEAGADYVAFGDPVRPVNYPLLDAVSWWSEVFVLPCLALGLIDAQSCPALVRAGADFLGVSEAVWEHPDGAAAGVRALQDATAAARTAPPTTAG